MTWQIAIPISVDPLDYFEVRGDEQSPARRLFLVGRRDDVVMKLHELHRAIEQALRQSYEGTL